MRIKIESKGGRPSDVKITHADTGESVYDVMAVDIRMRPNEPVTAVLKFWSPDIDGVFEAEDTRFQLP